MRAITALVLGGVLALTACSTATAPSPSAPLTPSPPARSSPSPSAEPTPTPTVATAPSPTVEPTSSPAVLNVTRADGERMLRSGVRQDLDACAPIAVDVLRSAVAGIRCEPASKVVAGVTLYLFRSQEDLLDAYETWLAAHDIPPQTNGGRCLVDRPSEGGYVPGDDHGIVVAERGGCYLDGSGKAQYAVTLPPFVLAEVDGRVKDIAAVEGWAWRGNQDQPGSPTIWFSTDP